jgi:hypothetical protein
VKYSKFRFNKHLGSNAALAGESVKRFPSQNKKKFFQLVCQAKTPCELKKFMQIFVET